MSVVLRHAGALGNKLVRSFESDDRSHALRGNAVMDAPRPLLATVTRSVTGCVPTQSMGTISNDSIEIGQMYPTS